MCEELAQLLAALQVRCELTVERVDIDADPTLAMRYSWRVPVLLDGDGRELCAGKVAADVLAATLGLEGEIGRQLSPPAPMS